MLSVIVLTRNRRDILVECLKSIFESKYSPTEIVVVDNGSNDGTFQRVRDEYPGVILVRSPLNLGAAGGRNLGFKNSTGEWLLFLDDDMILSSRAISALFAAHQRLLGPAILGGRLVGLSSRDRPLPVGFDISVRTSRLIPHFAEEKKDSPSPCVRVPMIGANCLFVSREDFDRLGGFDENFFIPYEDADLCLRARKLGMEVFCVMNAEVTDACSGRSLDNIRVYQIARNRVLFMAKHANSFQFAIFALLIPLFEAYYSVRGLALRNVRTTFAYLDGTMNALGQFRQFRRKLP